MTVHVLWFEKDGFHRKKSVIARKSIRKVLRTYARKASK
jgi:hypothetical protein